MNTIEGEKNQSDDSVVLKDVLGSQTTKGNDFKKTTTIFQSSEDSSAASDKLIKTTKPDTEPPQNSPESVLKIDLSKTDNSKKK